MRPIKKIIIHCTATKEGVDVTKEMIDKWHKARGFKMNGYHYIIRLDGIIERGRIIEQIGAHAKGHNLDSVGIAYVGGLDHLMQPKDTRTPKQKEAIEWLCKALIETYPSIKEIKGHRDYSPDKNNDGIITPDEWLKSCPCFEAEKEYGYLINQFK